MSLGRHAKRRDANESEIVEMLRLAGATVERIDTPGDLLVGYHGHTYLFEVKLPKEKLNKNQRAFADTWRGQYRVVTCAAEAIEAIGAIMPEGSPR